MRYCNQKDCSGGGRVEVKHLLSVLHQDVGVEALGTAVIRPLIGLKVAVHTGCHALRPGNVTRYDNPLVPAIFDELVGLTGAESVFWSMSNECCGNPQWDKNQKLALRQMQRKLMNAKLAGADYICTACTYCQMQFEQKSQSDLIPQFEDEMIPAILITQLIGLSVGIEDKTLGIGNETLQNFLAYAGAR